MFLGTISYSLYLWQFPLLYFGGNRVVPRRPGATAVVRKLLACREAGATRSSSRLLSREGISRRYGIGPAAPSSRRSDLDSEKARSLTRG